ncbi:Alginate biosynthesis protein AlgA [Paenibacillus konkukensis]|uniref:Alginate biosynthesis protein AlgA n=1 Tax=Paenibacillus konkukensis TaxID=2020716 RepID=A0ABY4RUG1_9BACL|nr:mannose-1-phosphate guanylyltransferase [Paenibacillus konkukensis]UQZ86259.1 Alginate biosynthesis protein AlgA [Paenibacillus konkukensis]
MKIVIMAGGKGTRIWPRSADDLPKQFLPFLSEQSLIQETVDRFRGFVPSSRLFIALPQRYLPIARQQLPDIPPHMLIVEPEQKDTAACVALAAFRFLQAGDDEPVAFIPSDQYVGDKEVLLTSLTAAEKTALTLDAIVTLGIMPTRPDTSYGYLLTSAAAAADAVPAETRQVARFVEKPSAERARELISDPNVYWNSGIIVARPATLRRSIELHEPAIWDCLTRHPHDPAAAYAGMPKLSIDHAVMERAEKIYCIPVECGWDDVGSWTSLPRHTALDNDGNAIRGDAELIRSAGNIVYVEGGPALIIGVNDLIVASTSSGLLICPKSEEPRLKSWLSSRK